MFKRKQASRKISSFSGTASGAVLLLLFCLGAPGAAEPEKSPPAQARFDPRDDRSPWGVASGAEWFSDYPLFNPMLKDAGVRWLRGFYEWQAIQPEQGQWDFALPDRLVENARANGIHLVGTFAYLAPWASADGGTRRFPIKNIQYWRDYVAGMVGRYHSEIKYWEIWNEFNGSFSERGTPKIYADLVREASLAAKHIDPTAKIGLSVASFDVGFLDATIKAGAAHHFDYICVHPYEFVSELSNGGEPAFLTMTQTLRSMLKANDEPDDLPLWITEIGATAPSKPDDVADREQGVLLVKAYLLSIATGFKRVFWFEARGPAYGKDADFGLIRSDMTARPSYAALKALTDTLGAEPQSAGWLDLGEGGYGFLFDTGRKPVLAAWAPDKRTIDIAFDADVHLINLKGENSPLARGRMLSLTDTPVLLTNLPTALVEQARSQASKPYPWGGDYSRSASVAVLLGVRNVENGVKQINLMTTVVDGRWRRTDFSRSDGEGHYAYFRVDPHFAPFGTKALEITAVVRRVTSDKVAGMSLEYESSRGYVNSSYVNITNSESWQEISWKVEDANFVGAWGWNFRLNAISSPNEFIIKEIRVRKSA